MLLGLLRKKELILAKVRGVLQGELWIATKDITKSILQTIGLLDGEGNFSFEEFKTRVKSVVTEIGLAITAVIESFKHLSEGMMYIGEILKGGVGGIGRALMDKGSAESKFLDLATISFGKGAVQFGVGTAHALKGMTAAVTPSDELLNDPVRALGTGSSVADNISRIRNVKEVGALEGGYLLYRNQYLRRSIP